MQSWQFDELEDSLFPPHQLHVPKHTGSIVFSTTSFASSLFTQIGEEVYLHRLKTLGLNVQLQ